MENFVDVENLDAPGKAHKKNLLSDTTDSISNSLEESIKETVFRDFETILVKLKFFFTPKNQNNQQIENEIRNYELWGPFVFFLLFSLTSSIRHSNMEDVFTLVIMVLVAGCFILTLNSKLLHTNISFLQGASAIGYSIFPMNIGGAFICMFNFLPLFLKLSIGLTCSLFSIKCGFRIMEKMAAQDKVYLVTFPLVIFYFSLSWFIIGC